MWRLCVPAVLALALAACRGGGLAGPTPSPTAGSAPTPSPTAGTAPTPSPTAASAPTPSPTAGSAPTAVYLSIGDSIQYGCCQDTSQSAGELFRAYLEQRLGRPVEWKTTAGNDTAHTFVNGDGGQTPQLGRAVETMQRLRSEGRPIVAITMSIGGNDYVEVGQRCPNTPCTDLFFEVLNRMKADLEQIYPAIVAAKPAGTPLMVVTYYNASDCGQPGVDTSPTELGQLAWNATIADVASRNGAFIVDGYTAFKGRACELLDYVDPNYAGYQVLAEAYERAYEALPPELVQPFAPK
jgi:lysophospholipase L1-like esterase